MASLGSARCSEVVLSRLAPCIYAQGQMLSQQRAAGTYDNQLQ
jgi:hypothetical protein